MTSDPNTPTTDGDAVALQEALREVVLVMTSGGTDNRDAIPNDYELALQGVESAVAGLIAAAEKRGFHNGIRHAESGMLTAFAADDEERAALTARVRELEGERDTALAGVQMISDEYNGMASRFEARVRELEALCAEAVEPVEDCLDNPSLRHMPTIDAYRALASRLRAAGGGA